MRYLRKQRERHGWTLAQAAEKLCMSPSALSRYECGIAEPGARRIASFAAIYDLPMSDLVHAIARDLRPR